MEPAKIERMFTRSDGRYLFARWGRPIVPVVFGVEDATVSILKGAIEAVVVTPSTSCPTSSERRAVATVSLGSRRRTSGTAGTVMLPAVLVDMR